MTKNKKWIVFGVFFVLLCSGGLYLKRVDEMLVVKHQEFIYCKLVTKGMTREQVESILLTVGAFRHKNKTQHLDLLERELYQFNDPVLSHFTGDYIIMGFKNNKLVTRYINTSISDHLYICKEDLESN